MYVANSLGLLFCTQLINNGHLIQSILRKDPQLIFHQKRDLSYWHGKNVETLMITILCQSN